MNKKLSSILLLIVLSVTDAYLLAHPNLIGRLGVLIYKHSYIRNFPRALLTVLLTVGVSLLICEGLYRFARQQIAARVFLALLLLAGGWFGYVYSTFSSLAYSITGKSFIYGAHLLPIILFGMFARYFVKVQFGVGRSDIEMPEGGKSEDGML
jgi:hypothetical protein